MGVWLCGLLPGGRRRGDDFLARLGGVIPEDGDAAPLQAGGGGWIETDFLRGGDGLLGEAGIDRRAEVVADRLEEHMLDEAVGADRDAQVRGREIGVGSEREARVYGMLQHDGAFVGGGVVDAREPSSACGAGTVPATEAAMGRVVG